MTATLYHAPLACSLAARMAAVEGDVPLQLEYLSLHTKELESGGSFLTVNPLGQVSTLKLSDGTLLTETSAVILWIQAQSTLTGFRVEPDTSDYFQMLRWIGFCATELHKQIFRIVFYDEATDEVKNRIRSLAPARLDLLNTHLKDRLFLLGDTFTAADAYLTWFFVLAERAQLDTAPYSNLERYRNRTLNRPKIQDLISSDMAKAQELR